MLEHLVQFEPEVASQEGFVELDNVLPVEVMSAQVATSSWLQELGVADDEDISKEAQTSAARESFKAVTTVTTDEEQRNKLVQIKTPEAVRHLVGMLTAYDWEFVQQAKEIRGYTVAQLVEETKNPNSNVRLKALIALGKVTEVGLFTERIEIKKTNLTDEEIDKKLKDKLAKFMNVTDIDIEDIVEKPQPITVDEIKRPDSDAA
jgi:hypothetical protein